MQLPQSDEFWRLFKRIEDGYKDTDALILDFRDGWGGAQPHYLDLFNVSSPTMVSVDRQGHTSIVNFRWRKPVLMVVNEGTRSGGDFLKMSGFSYYGLEAIQEITLMCS